MVEAPGVQRYQAVDPAASSAAGFDDVNKEKPHCFFDGAERPQGVAAVHETIRKTPVMALGIADHVWTIGELMGAGLENAPRDPRKHHGPRRQFRVIEGGRRD